MTTTSVETVPANNHKYLNMSRCHLPPRASVVLTSAASFLPSWQAHQSARLFNLCDRSMY